MDDRERSPPGRWAERDFVLRELEDAARRDARRCDQILQNASDDLRGDKEVVLQAVQGLGAALQHASEELKADREVVLIAVRSRANLCERSALQDASEGLRGDKDVVLAAVSRRADAWQHAAEHCRANREIVVQALSACPVVGVSNSCHVILKHASAELRADREIVLEAVTRSYAALQYASAALQGDREVVMKAVGVDNGEALQFAADSLKADPEIVLKAVSRDVGLFNNALRYARPNLQLDPAFVVQVIDLKSSECLLHLLRSVVARELLGNLQVIRSAAVRCQEALRFAANGVGVQLVQDACFRQEYLSNYHIFIIRSMSGRPCVDIYMEDDSSWLSGMTRRALRGLNFEKHDDPDFREKAALFTLAGAKVVDTTPLAEWVQPVEVLELQLVVSS